MNRLTRPLASRRLLSLLGTAALALGSPLFAQSTWSGAGLDANWSTSGNWSPALSNSFSTSLIFSGGTQLANTNDLTGGTATALTFNVGAGAFVIGGNAITLGGAITNNSTSLQTINLDLATTAVRTVTLTTGGGNVTLGGVISGTNGGLTTAGAGTLTLNGASTYTGATTIGAGTTLRVGNTAALGATTGALTIASGGTLDLNGNSITKGNFSATTATATVNSASAATLTINYQNTANLYSGLSLTNLASLMVNGSGGTGNAFGTGATIAGTGSLGFQNQTSVVRMNGLATNLGANGTLLFNGSGMIQNSAAITTGANNPIVVNGTGNVWHSSVNTAVGTNINGAWSGSGAITLFQGFNSQFAVGGDMTAFNGTVHLQNENQSNSTSIRFTNTAASVAGSAGAVFTQSARASNATTTGTNTIQWIGTGSRTIALGDLTTTGPGGSFSTNAFLQNSTNSTTATFRVGALGNTSTYGGIIRNGTGTNQITALEKVGTGTWTLTGANTYTGGTTINAGAINAGSAGALGTGFVTVDGGALTSSVGSLTGLGAVSLFSGSLTLNGTGAGSFAASSFTMSGGAWSVSIGDTASISGNVNISGGVLDVAAFLGSESTYTSVSGYTLFSSIGGTSSIGGLSITGYDTNNWVASLGNDGVLSFAAAIPEPSAFATLAGALALGAVAVRRRRTSV